MNQFTYSYPTKVYFGQGIAQEALAHELLQVDADKRLGAG